jgi:lysophospholipase L1-like esterase
MKRFAFFLILITLGVNMGFAQGPTKIETPDYSFTHFDRNHLVYPGDSVAMERFFDKLDSLLFTGQGHVRIMHIGGSHVQAGVFSQQMRDNLLNLAPGITAGRGLVFPYMMTNTPASYSISRTGEWEYFRNALPFETRMGLAGASVTTSDTAASFSIVTREKAPRDITPVFDFNYVKILGYGSLTPVVHVGDKALKGTYNADEGAYTFILPEYTDSLYVDFDHQAGTFTVTGVYLDNGMPGITYHGIGINGARVDSYLKCQDLKRDLRLVNPDLVIFGIGINDAAADTFTKEKFISDYSMLLDTILEVNPECALLFVTNNDSYKKVSRKKYEVNPNGVLAEEVFMVLGKKYNGAVWDFFDIMGGLRSMQDWQDEGIAQKDKVHFTSAGYALIGDLLFNALMEKYTEHLKHKNK